MRYFASLISLFLVISLVIGLIQFTSYYPQSFKVLFIIPLGSGIIGGLSAYGYAWFCKKYNEKPRHPVLACSLIGLISFVALYFALYATSYVDENMEINHLFKGEHISNFSFGDSDEPINIKNYIIHDINQREMSFFVGAGKKGAKVPVPVGSIKIDSWINLLMFIVEGLGYIVGGAIVGINMLEEPKRLRENTFESSA